MLDQERQSQDSLQEHVNEHELSLPENSSYQHGNHTIPVLADSAQEDNDDEGTEQEKEDSDDYDATQAFFENMQLKRRSTFWPTDKELLTRHPSLELLVPAHDCHTRRSSPAIAIFNLVATVCGGGVLSLPMAFSKAGLVPSLLLVIFAAGITNFSMYILCSCARRTGGRSYGDVMRNAFGPLAEIAATMLLCLLLFFVLVAYMVLLKDIWTPVILKLVPALQEFFVWWVVHYSNTTLDTPTATNSSNGTMDQASHCMLVVLLVCTFPLLLQTDLHALRHTCYIGFASAVVLMLGVTQQAFQRNVFDQPGLFGQHVLWVGDLDGIVYAFPIIVLSFFSIYNVLTVHSALYNPTRSRVKFVLDGTIGLCFFLFFTVGVGGYLYSYNDTRDNILLNFPLSVKTILIGRIGYGITIMFGMPLVFLPCRAAILSLPTQIKEWRETVQKMQDDSQREVILHHVMQGAKHRVANSVTFDEECPLLLEQVVVSPRKVSQHKHYRTNSNDKHYASGLANKDQDGTVSTTENSTTEDSYENEILTTPLPPVDPSMDDEAHRNRRIHVLSSMGILLASYVMAVGVPGVGVVWSIAGSSMAIVIGLIIPAACYLKIRSQKSINPRSVGATLLLIFSVITSVVCTYRTIQEL